MSSLRSTCPYCGVGCGLKVEVHDGAVAVSGDEAHPANLGRLCSKGMALGETLDMDDRLLEPVVDGAVATWDTALDRVANGFRETVARYGPDSVAFYVSGQLLTEDYYVANKLMKGFIGTGNIDTNSRLCMASAVAGYRRAFGADYVPVSYEDVEAADLIVAVGANVAWCHPVIYQRIRQAKANRPGMKLVVIDPRRTATCDLADLHLAIDPGADVALFNGLLSHLVRTGQIDRRYIHAHTDGFGQAVASAQHGSESIDAVAAACGLPAGQVAAFFELFASQPKTVTLFSQGVNQSTAGTDKVNAIVNVHLATGRIGRAGAGPFSLTGQPNAMGGREVGGLANQLAAHMDFTPADIDRVRRFWHAPSVATKPGLKAVDLFEAVYRGEIRAIWIMSTNPVVSMPDADRVRAALKRCPLVVVSDCIANTDTARCADVLLPAASWGEKSGTVTNSERRISRQRQFLPAPGNTRPDWAIVCEVARRMGFAAAFDFDGPAAIFREHARLSAFENHGTRDFDIGGLADVGDEAYDRMTPMRWPIEVNPGQGPDIRRGEFFTANGRARFAAVAPRAPAVAISADYPLRLLTGRIRDQWHTMTRTGKSAKLSQTVAEPFVEVHPADSLQYGLSAGGLAEVVTPLGTAALRVRVVDTVRRGELFAPMHWNDRFANKARIGSLLPAFTDPLSGQPELKAMPVSIRPLVPAWQGFVLSREALDLSTAAYAAASRGNGYWRYEVADSQAPDSWHAWARSVLGTTGDWVEFSDRASGRYRGARIVDGRLLACAFVASGSSLPDRAWLGTLFHDDALEDSDRANMLAGRPADPSASTGPQICACFGVGRDTLIATIASERLTTVDEIGRLLKAGTNCGSCIPELNGLLREVRSDASAPEAARAAEADDAVAAGNDLATEAGGAPPARAVG